MVIPTDPRQDRCNMSPTRLIPGTFGTRLLLDHFVCYTAMCKYARSVHSHHCFCCWCFMPRGRESYHCASGYYLEGLAFQNNLVQGQRFRDHSLCHLEQSRYGSRHDFLVFLQPPCVPVNVLRVVNSGCFPGESHWVANIDNWCNPRFTQLSSMVKSEYMQLGRYVYRCVLIMFSRSHLLDIADHDHVGTWMNHY